MHKTLLCMVFAAAFGLIVNWYEEMNMVMQFLTAEDCANQGVCLEPKDSQVA